MRAASPNGSSERLLLGVGQLVAALKAFLDDHVGRVWVVGEISNLHQARSGHAYFTLKDEEGQLRAALFRGDARRVPFDLEEGLEVVAEADVSIYAARGELQLVVRGLEPRGLGALQLAFEQLRRRLEAEGLFDPARKRPIPVHPRRLGVVTSPTGAAVRDVLQVAGRRLPSLPILISPCLVQGERAPEEIAAAIERLALVEDVDVILLVRGGGSIEDLQAFNSERVARALVASPRPIVSGVGHETDLTIADLVADARAPTPSAAAMQVVPDRRDLARGVQRDVARLVAAHEQRLERARYAVERWTHRLRARSPLARMSLARSGEARARAGLFRAIEQRVDRGRRRLSEAAARLDALSPLAVLGRGYALVRREADGRIVRTARELAVGERLRLRLGSGEARADVVDLVPEDPPRPRARGRKTVGVPGGSKPSAD